VQIVQLQHKKLAMTEAALSTDPDAALGKLTVEDVGPRLNSGLLDNTVLMTCAARFPIQDVDLSLRIGETAKSFLAHEASSLYLFADQLLSHT
jgi:hypothetical protein